MQGQQVKGDTNKLESIKEALKRPEEVHTCSDSFTLVRVENNLRRFGSFQLPSFSAYILLMKVAENCQNI